MIFIITKKFVIKKVIFKEAYMSLLSVNKGQEVILKDIDWGIKLKRKLQNMGLTPGVKINMIQRSSFGPCVVEVRGTRLALGRGIVSKIFVDLA